VVTRGREGAAPARWDLSPFGSALPELSPILQERACPSAGLKNARQTNWGTRNQGRGQFPDRSTSSPVPHVANGFDRTG
jgi:hypothetical protein